ncbi:MAG: histidine phosphatase family protein [Chitinophagaceae bacterium]
MKSLLIVRHAKSSWDPAVTSDFDRKLNHRGKSDAPEMAGRLKEKNILPDIFISSPAKRARKTAELFGEVLAIRKQEILLIDQLYEAAMPVFFQTVSDISDSFQVAGIFAHNPGITDFVNALCSVKIDDMPTCGIFGVKIYTEKWAEFEVAEKEFWFFDYPKLID